MERQELITNKEYILAGMQLKILNLLEEFMQNKNLKRNELAEKLEVTKGYISQIMNVAYDHKLTKVIELALACEKVPMLFFVEMDKLIQEDRNDKEFALITVPIVKNYDIKNMDIIESYNSRNENYLKLVKEKSATQAFIIKMDFDNDRLRKIS